MKKTLEVSLAILAILTVLVLAVYNIDKYSDERVYDFESCVKITGISTDGNPSECVYRGRNYVEEIKSLNKIFMVPDLDSCFTNGGRISEQVIYCVTTPCNPIQTCIFNGKTYANQLLLVESFKSGCDSVNGTLTEMSLRCVDANGVSYIFVDSYDDLIDDANKIDSYEDCISAGFPIQETAPPRCMDSQGQTFIQK